MARLIGVDPSTLGRLKQGKSTPSEEQKQHIFSVTNKIVTID